MNGKPTGNDAGIPLGDFDTKCEQGGRACDDGRPPMAAGEAQAAESAGGALAGNGGPAAPETCAGATESKTNESTDDLGFAAQDIMDWLTDFKQRFGDTIENAAGSVPGNNPGGDEGASKTVRNQSPGAAEGPRAEPGNDAEAPNLANGLEKRRTGITDVGDNSESNSSVVTDSATDETALVAGPSDTVAADDIPVDTTMLTPSEVFTEVPLPAEPEGPNATVTAAPSTTEHRPVAQRVDQDGSVGSSMNNVAATSPGEATGPSNGANGECHERQRARGFFARLWAVIRGKPRTDNA